MRNLKTKTVCLIGVLIILLFCVGAWQRSGSRTPDSHVRQIYLSRDPYESNDKAQFWIRVTEHPEAKSEALIAGAFYSFDSGQSELGPWKNVMTVHLDDPDPIPVNNVQFVTNKVAYFFLYDKLAVTSDGGASWFSWDLGQANQEWRPKRAIIRAVDIEADGIGTMTIEVFSSGAKITLRTKDFGKSWTEK